MVLAKKGFKGIKDALAQVDDKAEFINTVPMAEEDCLIDDKPVKMTIGNFASKFDLEDETGINVFDETELLGVNLTNALALVTTGLKTVGV